MTTGARAHFFFSKGISVSLNAYLHRQRKPIQIHAQGQSCIHFHSKWLAIIGNRREQVENEQEAMLNKFLNG